MVLGLFAAHTRAALLDPSFGNPDWNLSVRVSVFALQPDGKVVVGGSLVDPDYVNWKSLTRLNADGSEDAAFNATVMGSTNAILVQPDGKIVLAGDFTAGGNPIGPVVRLNPDGSLDGGFAPPAITRAGAGIKALALQPDGKLLVAGRLSRIAGVQTPCIARLNADGSHDPSFTSALPLGATYDNCINTIAVRTDGKITAGGFGEAPDGSMATLFRLNPDGSFDANLTATSTITSEVYAIGSLPNGKLYAAGFSDPMGILTFKLVRFNSDDTLDGSFQPSAPTFTYSFFSQPDGRIVVGGEYGVRRLNNDGSIDASFDPGDEGRFGQVRSLAAQADGRILVGGAFTQIGNPPVTRLGIARLSAPDPATSQLSLASTHEVARWHRSGSGMDLSRATIEVSRDGSVWSEPVESQWSGGDWIANVTAASDTRLWLRARGFASGGGSDGSAGGFNASVVESTQQVVAAVTPSASSGGSITPSSTQFVDVRSPITFSLMPDAGQRIQSVGGTCNGHLDGNDYVIASVTADCAVEAVFVPSGQLTVTPSATAGGHIAPDTPRSVLPGEQVSFQIVADSGYVIDNVGGTCGGNLDGPTYTTQPITANCTVEAGFRIRTFTVSAHADGGHGSIGPIQQSVDYGAVATLTVHPEAGYNANVSGCEGVLGPDGTTFTTGSVTADCEVTAQFLPYASGGASLQLTLAPLGQDPCSGSSHLEVRSGQQVAYCLTFTNGSARALSRHTAVRGAIAGDLNGIEADLGGVRQPVAPGERLRHGANQNLRLLPRRSTDLVASWASLDASSATPVYTREDNAAFTTIDLSSSPTAVDLALARPRTSESVRLPFSFNFFGVPVDQLCIGNDGVIRPALQSCETTPASISGISVAERTAQNYAEGYEGGSVYFDVLGNPPARRAVVEWRDKHIAGTNGTGITFQAIIEEATGAITFQYVSMYAGAGSANYGAGSTVGPRFGEVNQSSRSNGDLTDRSAIIWRPGPQPYTAIAHATAHITVLAAQIDIAPEAISAQAVAGSATSVPLTLGNLGNVPLDWQAAAAGDGRGFKFEETFAAPFVPSAPEAGTVVTRPVPSDAAARESGQAAALVPAYAHAWADQHHSRMVSFNAGAPGSLSQAGISIGIWGTYSGGFLDNDFTRLYLIGDAGCSSDACWDPDLRVADIDTGDDATILRGANIFPFAGWRGMKWDPRSNTLFAVATNWAGEFGPPPPYRTDLYRIDPLTGLTSHVARIDDLSAAGTVLVDIAIDSHGHMYGIDMYTDTLLAIDKQNGHVRPIGPTGLNVGYYSLQSMDFDHAAGALYYATWTVDSTVGSQMFTLDTTTGAARLVGTIGDGSSGLRALSIATPGSPCADAGSVPWLTLDHDAGSIAPATSESVQVTLDARDLAEGEYRANVCIDSNTPYQRQVSIPVTFTVKRDEHLFTNGFDLN